MNISERLRRPFDLKLWCMCMYIVNCTAIPLLGFCCLTDAMNKQKTTIKTTTTASLMPVLLYTRLRGNESNQRKPSNNGDTDIVANLYVTNTTITNATTSAGSHGHEEMVKVFMWPTNSITTNFNITSLLKLGVTYDVKTRATTKTARTPMNIKLNDFLTITDDKEVMPTINTTAYHRHHQHHQHHQHHNNNSIGNNETANQPVELMSFHQQCLEERNSWAHLFTIFMYSVVYVVGLVGNTLVIWVVLRFSKMQTVTNVYILNLAIADECFLIGIPFLLYTMRICSWKFGDYMCKAYMVSTSITQFTSSIFLIIMAADRYIAVCHPIESPRYRTLHMAKLVSLVAWFTSALLMLPVILFASTIQQEDGVHYSCNIDWPETYRNHSGVTFILYTLLLGFFIPLSFIMIFYILVLRKLHAVQRKHKSKEKKRSHRKVTRLVLTVITVYVLCWLPHWISQVSLIPSYLTNQSQEQSPVKILLFLTFGCLAYSNSAMNPLLYAFLSENFRKSFSKAFACVNQQDMDAQLFNEHSVITHKRTASSQDEVEDRKRGQYPRRRLSLQHPRNNFLPTTMVRISAGSLSSDTKASTATTVTDKSSTSGMNTMTHSRSFGKRKKCQYNGGFNAAALGENEKVVLVVNQIQQMQKSETEEQQTNV